MIQKTIKGKEVIAFEAECRDGELEMPQGRYDETVSLHVV